MTKRNLYEERVTIWRASSHEEAIALAEAEAEQYATDTESEYLGLAQGYETYEARLRSGAEVYSLMRESNLSPKRYLDRFFDTRDERQGDMPCEQSSGHVPK
jgi:hypothetical protein